MASGNNFGDWSITHALLTMVCAFFLFRLIKYLIFGEANLARNSATSDSGFLSKRRLGCIEEFAEIVSIEMCGSGNVCVVISLLSKVSLVRQHVRDALVLLAKRQPMLRAAITRMENGHRYFEVKDINEVISKIDITFSDVTASEWQNVWFESTSQLKSDLLWRVVILQEELVADTQEYANTLMFAFKHASIDGVSCVKFCQRFLVNINSIANGAASVDQEIVSLDLVSNIEDITTRCRRWHLFLKFILAHIGLRPIFKLCMKVVLSRLMQSIPYNPYFAEFPPNLEPSDAAAPVPTRLTFKVFDEIETKNIVKACKAHKCTVTGAIMAAAHLALCQLLDSVKAKDSKLRIRFPINGLRCCDPKPHRDYVGCFLFVAPDYYMKYMKKEDVDFWKVAQETTRDIHEIVNREAYVTTATLMSETVGPKHLVRVASDEKLLLKASCNVISSFGAFDFRDEMQSETYKLKECFMNALIHNLNYVFFHSIHTINGKLTWQVKSNTTVDAFRAQKFADLCFDRFVEVARYGKV